ncbi:hypothetical protein MPTK1_7g18110 [Marchantia polymorpha subsp. ruderalis]|uniref:Uncharacterized protein n=2 Tax=Marchantia polymorpha TaxID=3197 RepID=A0AAF6C0Z5_MARPO|nr:hypothetical protein MARPO_0102s0029 [Marchantia polymorpha]BBN17929.1 hypothetical protein Mp_7g18110 [Marchantia polymorpha subsp. ruderalis]|eukprot:PTQ32161.1 hypothetical protein MARPO_0102s0029 [Marchantia polymorpha]
MRPLDISFAEALRWLQSHHLSASRASFLSLSLSLSLSPRSPLLTCPHTPSHIAAQQAGHVVYSYVFYNL